MKLMNLAKTLQCRVHKASVAHIC